MESIIDTLRVGSLREQIEASRLNSAELASKIDRTATLMERATIARQYFKSLKETRAMQLLLEILAHKQTIHPPIR